MANKFTTKIDEMFAKYGRPDGKDEYIILGYCHSGDEDGNTDDYEYFDCVAESDVEGWHAGKERRSHCLYPQSEKLVEDFEKDWDNLSEQIWDAFRSKMRVNMFESTNCYWSRYFAVTKDHKLVSFVSRGDMSDGDEEIIDLDTYSQEQADTAADYELLGYIQEKCEGIKSNLSDMTHDEIRQKAIAAIKELLKE